MLAHSRCAALACLLLAAAPTAADLQDPLERVQAAFSAGRYDEALGVARELEDPALAAEWASYLHGVAGDLPGSLREARAGLVVAPRHAGLLTQALNASLTLGLAEGSGELAERLLAASAGAGAAERASVQKLAEHARELERRDALAARSVARARALVLVSLAASVLALVGLSRNAAPRS